MSFFRKIPWFWWLLAMPLTLGSVAAIFFSNIVGQGEPDWPRWTGWSFESGSQFVLEVDTLAFRRALNEMLPYYVLGEVPLPRTSRVTDAGVDVLVTDANRQSALTRLAKQFNESNGFNLSNGEGGAIRIAYTEARLAEKLSEFAELSARNIEFRLSSLGGLRISNLEGYRLSVRRQPDDRILVRVSRSDDLNRLIDFATKPGKLEFRWVSQRMKPEQALSLGPPPDTEILYGSQKQDKRPYLIEKRVILSGMHLEDAKASSDQRTLEPVVAFRLKIEGARRFAVATSENVGRPFAILFDDEVLSAPVVREPITGGSGQISGGFTAQFASELSILLRAGALPVRLRVVEQR